MTRAPRTAIALFLFIAAGVLVARAHGQSMFDRTVGRFPNGNPIMTFDDTRGLLLEVAASAGIQVGVEEPDPPPRRLTDLPHKPVRLTGLTVGEALRYFAQPGIRLGWREDDGVAVVRPAASWDDDAHPLHLPAPAVRADNVTPNRALALACALLGALEDINPKLGVYGRFAIDFPGGTVLELLTEIVRASGAIGWEARFADRDHARDPRMIVLLRYQKAGGECEVPGRSPEQSVNPEVFLAGPAPASVTDGILDRLVGLGREGRQIEMQGYRGPGPFDELAKTTGVPFGAEALATNNPTPSTDGRSAVLTGKTLRAALDTIVDLDPRFEWRNMDGVIVIRPVGAWNDTTHQLSRAFQGFFGTVRIGEAMAHLAADMGSKLSSPLPYRDTTSVDLAVPSGTIIDFVNGIARARGETMWKFGQVYCCKGPAGERYELTIFSGDTFSSFWVK